MRFKNFYNKENKESFSEKIDKKMFSIIESLNKLNKIPYYEKTEMAYKLEQVFKQTIKKLK